jgi:hypothetical protein
MVGAAILPALLIAAPLPKLAVSPLAVGDGVSPGTVKLVGEAVSSELRRQKSFAVLTYDELQTVLSHEQLKQLVGCADAGCFANVGNAAGADALVGGSLGQVGTSWIVTLKIIDVKKVTVAAVSDRRIKGGTLDDVLDQLPGMVGELVEGAVKRMGATDEPAAVTPVTAAPAGVPLPVAWAERALTRPVAVEQLRFFTDGKGHFLAFVPESRYSGPIFAGGENALHLQRVTGGGADSGRGVWNAVFWEPRVRNRGQAQVAVTPAGVTMHCGEASVDYGAVSAAEGARLRHEAKLFDVRWQRAAIYIARDDSGTYFLVDQAREPEGNTDYRLFVGPRGRVEYLPLSDVILDAESAIFLADRGRFIVRRKGEREEAVWAVGAGQQPLTLMDLYAQAPSIYTTLGVYAGQKLGTACDPHLAP